MNIILEGPDAVGKTTLADKLRDKFGMTVLHSTSKTRNDLHYHIDLLDYRDKTVFDRFHLGEMIYPIIYNRPGKLSENDFNIINKRLMDNNDILIIFITSNLNIINERLIERGEQNYIPEMEDQNKLFTTYSNKLKKYNYKNLYIIDIAEDNAYDKLDKWIDDTFGKSTPNSVYRKLANDLLDFGKPIDSSNPRGATMELTNYEMTIDDISGNECITLSTGGTNLTYVAAELLWYWSARNDLDFINKFSNFWKKVTDDGITANSAYGYILQKKHGFNQIDKIIELLKHDRNSRRAVLNINVPNEYVIETHDEMCTICINYHIRDNKLYSTCVLRSNDFNFGLRNDLPFFISLQKYIADELGVGYGSYTHYAFSMHMYNRDFEFAKKVAYGNNDTLDIRLDIKKLLSHREELVDWVDNEFTSRDDFTDKLKQLKIIYNK